MAQALVACPALEAHLALVALRVEGTAVVEYRRAALAPLPSPL
jgi:hypothetical protein